MLLSALLAAAHVGCVVAAPGGAVAADLLAARLDERLARPIARHRCADMLVVGPVAAIGAMLPASQRHAWRRAAPRTIPDQGYAVRRLGRITAITAADTRGLVYGAGWALRAARTAGDHVRLAAPPRLDRAPAYPVRMTQIGYRAKNNSYDAWTLAMLRRRIEDFALWGASGVQVIAPNSDDAATSPLFPAPPVETLAGIGQIAHRLGLDFALYYPLLGDYDTAGATDAEIAQLSALIVRLPRIDAFYIPGGDPGHTAPPLLFRVAARAAQAVRTRDPAATVWLSTQGFDRAGYDQFYAELARRPDWLTGIFVGPQSRDPLPLQRKRIPARYPIELYPDIGHTMHAQFPVPRWSPAFALTEGREPIDPRPAAFTRIFGRQAALSQGFVTYSEGVNDDVNQLLWFQLGWTPDLTPAVFLRDYARAFVGDPRAAGVIAALERNWIGNPAGNAAIDATLAAADRLRPARWADWRVDSLRYRAVYDALVRRRLIAACARQAAATDALSRGDAAGAIAALDRPDGAAIAALDARLHAIADRLFKAARLQLSVPLYGASAVERGANLDSAAVGLNDRVWLETQIAAGRGDRVRLAALADHARHREGALYDDLGNPQAEPHLVRGRDFVDDPQGYGSAIDGIADMTPGDGWRMSQVSYAETLYDAPIRLHYDGLDRRCRYRLVATWAGEGYAVPMRLIANGTMLLHDYRPRTSNPMTVETPIPPAATAGGTLDLAWNRPPRMGGSGRGHQIAETWLIPDPSCGAHR
jgi:hypothetical protein